MDKEDVVHIYNEILFSHKKEQNNAISAMWMDFEIILSETSQRKISYGITYIWNLKKLYKRTYKTETDSKISKPNLWLPKGKWGKG